MNSVYQVPCDGYYCDRCDQSLGQMGIIIDGESYCESCQADEMGSSGSLTPRILGFIHSNDEWALVPKE